MRSGGARVQDAHVSALQKAQSLSPKIFRITPMCFCTSFFAHLYNTPFHFAMENNYPFVANGLSQATSRTGTLQDGYTHVYGRRVPTVAAVDSADTAPS